MSRKTAKRRRTGRKMTGGGKTYCCKSTGECTPSWTGRCVGYSANTGDKKYKCEPDISATVASMDASKTCSPDVLEDSATVVQNGIGSGLNTIGTGIGSGLNTLGTVGKGVGNSFVNGVSVVGSAAARATGYGGKRRTKKNKSKRSKK